MVYPEDESGEGTEENGRRYGDPNTGIAALDIDVPGKAPQGNA